MAVYFATSADYLERTTDLRAASATRTAMCWTRQRTLPSAPGEYNIAYSILNAVPASYTEWAGLMTDSFTPGDTLDVNVGSHTVVGDTSYAAGTWTHHCWIYSTGTNSHTYYRNGLIIGGSAFVLDIDGMTVVTDVCGGDSFALGDFDVLYFRMWSAALSQAQVQAERLSGTVIRTTNLFMDTPLESDLLDLSGNGRDWTAVGFISFTSDVPAEIPLNRTAETAITLPTVPFSLGQVMPTGLPTGPVNSNLWFSYTAPADTLAVIGIWFSAPVAGEYQPKTFTWLGPAASPTEWVGAGIEQIGSTLTNVPVTVPVHAGDTYFFQVTNDGTTLTADATLTISGLEAPSEEAPVNSIALNDDTPGLPLALLSRTDATTLQDIGDFPAGEAAAVLPDGTLCVEDETFGFRIYNIDLVLQASIPYPAGWPPSESTATSNAISQNQNQTFYVGTFGKGVSDPAEITTISSIGTLGATTWVLTGRGLGGIAPNLAGTVLYYSRNDTATIGSPIQRWDLVNDVALADLAAGVPNYGPSHDILLLSDDTIIVGYQDFAAPDFFIRHYDAAGTVLHTYALGSLVRLNRLAHAIDDPASFWVWAYIVDPDAPATFVLSRFLNIRVTDGVVLEASTPNARQYEIGQYQGIATDTPDRRFGHSNSCPFWLIRSTIPAPGDGNGPEPPVPPDVGPGGLEFDPTDIRWLRQTPVMSDENKAMLHRELTLDLEAGVGLREGQGYDPLVMLQMSNDSGHTWHNLHPSSIGKRGEYRYRVNWHRLGQSRNRLYRFYGSDPVKICLIDAYTEIERGDGS